MDLLEDWWGIKENISPGETAARAAAMFVFLLVSIRLLGIRTFGRGSLLDNINIILLGSVLGRGVVGATPFISALAGGLAILLLHKLLAIVSFYYRPAGRYIKGEHRVLYRDGEFDWKNMRATEITENDIRESLRNSQNTDDLKQVEEAYIERSGKISFIKKEA